MSYDFSKDPEFLELVRAERSVRASGASAADVKRAVLKRGRYINAKRREWNKAHPELKVEKEQLDKALEASDLEDLVGKSARWMRGRGFELLTKTAEGQACSCCVKCKARVPDLRAISLLAETVNKAIALELARIESRRSKKQGAELVDLEWPSEGAKS